MITSSSTAIVFFLLLSGESICNYISSKNHQIYTPSDNQTSSSGVVTHTKRAHSQFLFLLDLLLITHCIQTFGSEHFKSGFESIRILTSSITKYTFDPYTSSRSGYSRRTILESAQGDGKYPRARSLSMEHVNDHTRKVREKEKKIFFKKMSDTIRSIPWLLLPSARRVDWLDDTTEPANEWSSSRYNQ